MLYTVIMNVNLEYTFDVDNKEEALEKAMDTELPNSYVDDSCEIVKVIKEEKECKDYDGVTGYRDEG